MKIIFGWKNRVYENEENFKVDIKTLFLSPRVCIAKKEEGLYKTNNYGWIL